MDSAIEQMRASTVSILTNWQDIAQKLGKNEKYVERIKDITESFKNNENINLNNAFAAMTEDIKDLEKLNNITRMVQRVANTIGVIDEKNVLGAKTTNGYEFAVDSSEKNLLVRNNFDF